MRHIMPTITLITGANKGIGLETARQLGAMGHTILLGARSKPLGEAAVAKLRDEKITAHLVVIDVSDVASIRAAAESIDKQFGQLDVLINNAGTIDYEKDGPVGSADVDAVRDAFDVNFFGTLHTTQAFLPLLKKSAAGRVVNLTSILASIAEHGDKNSPIYARTFIGYNASKAAVNMLTVELAVELRETKIKVNAAHPGWVKTDMGTAAAPMHVEEGAKTSVMLATLPEDGPTGGFYHMGVHMRW